MTEANRNDNGQCIFTFEDEKIHLPRDAHMELTFVKWIE